MKRFFEIRFPLILLGSLALCLIACQSAENASTQNQARVNTASERVEPEPAANPQAQAPAGPERPKSGAVRARGGAVAPGSEVEDTASAPESAGENIAAKRGAGPQVQDRIVVARFNTVQNGPPAGWTLDLKKGSHNFSVERDGQDLVLHMVSKNNSFGIKKEAHVNVREYPYLNWRWKAVRVPPGGDVRNAGTDDQAIQLYIAFPAMGWPAALNSPVIGYVWDNESPRGYYGRCRQIGGDKLRYLVLRNKGDKTGEWQVEKRNVYQDYKTLFKDIKNGEPDAVTNGLQIHINSQHTGTEAESYIGEIYFTKS